MINSHIQMPKVLLKRFHNEQNRFYYFDVRKNVIGNNGTAKSINTELEYYSEQMEEYLRDTIETPFGNVLTYIERNNIDSDIFTIDSEAKNYIKDFMYALIARGLMFNQQMDDEEDLLKRMPVQFQHDFVAKTGIKIAQENNLFSEYIITFMINKTKIPFVLSMDGIYSYTLNGHKVINLPISPYVTASLIHESYSSRVINEDNSVAMFEINRDDMVQFMNERAFSSQLRLEWGYIVCPEKEELIRLEAKYKMKKTRMI